MSFNTALAQNTVTEGLQVIQQPLGLANFDIRIIIANIIRAALGLIGIVLVCLMLYAGYLWMTAGGNEEQIAQAKSIIRNAVIGLAIILSAYSIVAFIMKMLGVNDVGGSSTTNTAPSENYNFAGSGALGKVIRDHYPARDQKDVPRNTKIVITFNKPVYLPSFVVDTNNNKTFGDCINTDKATFNWNTDCDHAITTSTSDDFINVKRTDNNQSIVGLVVLSSISTSNNIQGHFTLVLKPITNASVSAGGYLGSDTDSVGYTVTLGKKIEEDNAENNYPSIFDKQQNGNDFYSWQFICNNALDLTPPTVEGVFPNSVANNPKGEARNSVIQVTFSEPIDPTGLQGSFTTSSFVAKNYYEAPGAGADRYIYLKNLANILPAGTFSLVNNYKTLEFTPSLKCGVNACGEDIFCLNQDDYILMLKAAKTLANTFQSQPFTGIADMASNALDGNKNGSAQTATTTLPVFDNGLVPDNYYWNFKINSDIDITAPYLTSITPAVDSDYIAKDQPWKMVFSKQMRVGSLYSIELAEFPTTTVGNVPWIPLWHLPSVGLDYQAVTMQHGTFLDNEFYMPAVSSLVEDVHFNCFYPGLGPDISPAVSSTLVSPICDSSNPNSKCCSVVPGAKDFCCDGAVSVGQNFTQNSCINWIKNNKQLINN
ncbi:MAG: hypothetical protein NT034_00415 [Candidatus Magasanikbacteria bacterium]|nr:hypothetical protein [Candidatus Magasanikbacteria bacterium]